MSRFSNDSNNPPPFRPRLIGCVVQDLRMAHAIGECYQCELYAIAAYLWRSLVCERKNNALSACFEQYAREEIEHFRLLGELIVSLGARPALYTQVKIDPMRYSQEDAVACMRQLVREAIADERQMVDRYQTLMGKSGDRVVRSILAGLISDAHRHIEGLENLSCGP